MKHGVPTAESALMPVGASSTQIVRALALAVKTRRSELLLAFSLRGPRKLNRGWLFVYCPRAGESSGPRYPASEAKALRGRAAARVQRLVGPALVQPEPLLRAVTDSDWLNSPGQTGSQPVITPAYHRVRSPATGPFPGSVRRVQEKR